MNSTKFLIALGQELEKKYITETLEPYEEEEFEPEGLEGEILMRYGPKPPMNILLRILKEHDIKSTHAIGNAIYVFDGRDKKIIPANLKSVMTYLGY